MASLTNDSPRSTLIAALFLVVGATVAFAHEKAPPPCPETCVSFFVTGGLLGFQDGFPEYPGWPNDQLSIADRQARMARGKPDIPPQYGGLLGVTRWLEAPPRPTQGKPVLLLAGNNHPQSIHANSAGQQSGSKPVRAPEDHWFWADIAKLKSDAIAVGTEDIHRWLGEMGPAGLVSWIRWGIQGRPNLPLPFVASNVIVRRSGRAINVVADEKLQLELAISPTQSVGWLDEVSLSFPCKAVMAIQGAKLAFAGVDQPVVRLKKEADHNATTPPVETEDRCSRTLLFSERLRPGREYRLRIRLAATTATPAPHSDATFVIVTDDVLTPHANGGQWDGLPVVRVDRGSVQLAVMSFITPTVGDEVPPSYAKWTKADGCPAEACQLIYMPPAESARQLLDLGVGPIGSAPATASAVQGQRHGSPLLAALTDLSESEVGELLEQVPEIRLASVNPDSTIMGRAARSGVAQDGRRFSGDLSFGSIVDAQHPELTRLLVRPEWIGETVIEATTSVKAGGAGPSPWEITHAAIDDHTILGADLDPLVRNGEVRYRACAIDKSPCVEAADRTFRAYCPLSATAPFDGSGLAQEALWTSRTEFAGFVLDTMRQKTRSEIALVPQDWIDESVLSWLSDLQKSERFATKPVGWLSGLILGRIMYRAERVVRVSVDGPSVAKTITAVNDIAGNDGLTLCAAGLNALDCNLDKVDAKNVFVNARRPQPMHYYGLVLPASLARAAKLDFDDEDTLEFLPWLDARLSGACNGEPLDALRSATSLRASLEERRAAGIQRYLRLDPLGFEYGLTGVHEPPTAIGLFSKLPVDGSSAKDNRTLAIDADGDLGILDTRRFALRVPGRVRFTRQDLDDATAFDRDEYQVGFRGDYKKKMKGLVRLFVGAFVEGRFAVVESSTTPTRLVSVDDPAHPGTMLEDLSVSGPKLSFRTARRRFAYLSVGAELPKIDRTWGTLSEARLSIDYGRAANVPQAVLVGENRFSIDDFTRRGIDALVSDVYRSDPDTVTSKTFIGFDYERPRQARVQLDAKYEHKLWGEGKTTGELRTRVYRQLSNEPLLATRYSVTAKVALELPLAKRWSVAPYYERTVVDVKQVEGAFKVQRVGVQLKLASFFKWGAWSAFK